MEAFINYLPKIIADTITAVFVSLNHNWIPLSLAILTAALMKVYVNAEKLKLALLKKPKVSILASVTFGAFTPLCACGTMAVVIGLLTTTLPWGPIMAFLTSSPLMSPDTFIMIAGVINFKFAIALTIASLIIGFGSGGLAHLIDSKTNLLKDQLRLSGNSKSKTCNCNAAASEAAQLNTVACGCSSSVPVAEILSTTQTCGCSFSVSVADNLSTTQTCGCSSSVPVAEILSTTQTCGCSSSVPVAENLSTTPACGCGSSNTVTHKVSSKDANTISGFMKKIRIKEVGKALIDVGLKQILLYFCIFVGVGYLIQSFVPTSLIMSLFSGKSIFSVPLAALIGLPLYVSGDGAIPLIKTLMDGGAGAGAMMAFMITGPATSAWVIAGITAFMKRRVIGLYIGFVLVGGILIGYLYQLLISMGL